MITRLSADVDVRAEWEQQARNDLLPHWVRVVAYTWARADRGGHARLTPGQLGLVLGLGHNATSEAIRTARDRGILDETSSARCLVLAGHRLNPCEARHRGL
ncbi:hypothetical protein GCM10023340_36500 [Nocardioides marinquilinus]|uniref:MarR family transcriptional regulator n=1 Tax=Nocardioides marinquilinus TaxID=1210400 RepID=A0ABP9Q1P8_9ACTN